jgi:hypothetical protein
VYFLLMLYAILPVVVLGKVAEGLKGLLPGLAG